MIQSMQKKVFSFFATLVALCLATTGCGVSGSGSNKQPDSSMQLKVAGTADSIATGQLGRPWMQLSFPLNRAYRNLFLATSAELDVVPDMAKDYSISDDGLTYEITMRDDVFWSDGAPVVLEDVIFSIESCLALSTAESVSTLYITTFSGIEGATTFLNGGADSVSGMAIEDDTLSITLTTPNNLFLQVLSQFIILPQHALEGVDPTMIHDPSIDYWRDPVCSGMYKLDKHVENEYISLVYNKYFTDSVPHINSIMIRSDFEYDELDYSETNDVSMILDYRTLLNQKEYDVNSTFYRYFIFNIDKGGSTDPVLSDIRVRQALTYAIDREEIVKNVYYGIGDVNNTAVVQEYDNPIEMNYEYNPEKAKELLAEAKYDFHRPITLLYYYTDEVSLKFMEEVKEDLEEIGLSVDLIYGNYLTDEFDYYDMALKGLPVFSISDWYNEYWSTSQIHQYVFGGTPKFDDLIIELNQVQSEDERADILEELQELEYELLYKFPLFIMGHKVYINTDVTLPSTVKFGDSKYRYDLDFELWQINR